MRLTSNRTLFLLISLIVTLFYVEVVQAQGQKTATLTGSVLDENKEPVPNAIVIALGQRWAKFQATTDSSGKFSLVVNQEGWYSVYVICDKPETPGVDYVPSLWQTYLQLGSTANFEFTLEKGASICLDQELRFVESSEPVDRYTMSVTNPNGEPLTIGYSVRTYGINVDLVRRLGFNQNLIIIPADREVAIKVDAFISMPETSHSFLMKEKVGYFKLRQGELLQIPIMKYSIDYNIQKVKRDWDTAFSLLKDAENVGFMVSAERQDLLEAYGMIDVSILSMKKASYDEAFAALRNAYILTSGTIRNLEGLFQISSTSSLLLLPIFVFIASSVAYLITERRSHIEVLSRERKRLSFSVNFLISVAFYSFFIFIFYLAYPGCRLVSQPIFFSAAFLAYGLGQAVILGLPRLLPEKEREERSVQLGSSILIAFSMAYRNLRRRKMRTSLNLANVLILVFGFITFTSVSVGFGLVTQSLPPSIPKYAILIRDRLEGSQDPFVPLPSSFEVWLKEQPNITLISPKAENVPRTSLGELLTASGKKLSIKGILGIVPSVEANFTNINRIVVSGEYLKDDDLKGVLLCSGLEEILGVDVGDKLYGFNREFIIRGFFDKDALESLRDIDGQPLIPKYVEPPPSSAIVPCFGDKVIIVTYDAALSLPGVVTSRINVQLKNPSSQEYSRFASMVALSREYEVYVSQPGSLSIQYLGRYTEEKGAALIPFLMLLVVLNISAIMLGSVTERRDEIASLSSVGLNPTHISSLFVAEAVVIGLVGGGLGYFLGILGYRTALTTMFGALQVREKVSAEWGLIALLLSVCAAIVASLIPALKSSTIVTPSLMRKWSLSREAKPRDASKPWIMDLPVQLRPRELEPFIAFIVKRVKELASYANLSLKEEETENGSVKKLSFKYSRHPDLGTSENILTIQKAEDKDFFKVKLQCIPSRNLEKVVRDNANFVRGLIFEWNAKEFQVATPYDPSLSQLYTLVNAYNPTILYIATDQPVSDKQLEPLKRRLIMEGLRPPRMIITRVDSLNVEQCMKAASDLVSRADVVCISGQPDALCTTLAINAVMQKKMICYLVDPRPIEVRMNDPFRILKIVNL